MRPSQRRLGILLLGVAVLAALAAWQWHRQQADAHATLLTLAPRQVTRITVTRPGQAPLRYQKQDGHWYRTAPGPRRRSDDADMGKLAQLAATPVLQWRAAATLDPARIGLSPPALVLDLNGRRLGYGGLAAFGPQRFVRVGSRIAVVPARYSPRLPDPEPAPASSRTP